VSKYSQGGKMEDYKKEFINFLLDKEVLRIGEFKLKSGRVSPYFVNTGMFKDGESIGKLGWFYAAKIMDTFIQSDFDIIFGPAYKGIPLSVATTIALSRDFGVNKGYSFNRKEPKNHGEATQQKNWLVGEKIEPKDKILLIDDVFTTGDTKYEVINLLNAIAENLHFVGLIIAVDRQEIGIDGNDAIKQFEKKTGIPVYSIVNIKEIIEYLGDNKKITHPIRQRFENYLRKYGVKEVKEELRL
jgi:orotate phosphoribosyltransferase